MVGLEFGRRGRKRRTALEFGSLQQGGNDPWASMNRKLVSAIYQWMWIVELNQLMQRRGQQGFYQKKKRIGYQFLP